MKKGEKNIELYKKKTVQIDDNELNKTVRSQLDASKKYDKSVDIIKLRVPHGYKEKIQVYAKSHNYNSMNAFLVDLIEKKLDQDNM